MPVAKIPLTQTEIAAMREQMAAHATGTHGGFCPVCRTDDCDPWQEAAAALWWNNIDDRYEKHATDESKLLKIEIYATPQIPAALKAPLTSHEVEALRRQLARHPITTHTGWCPQCGVNWCPQWLQAASCLQLNGLDTAFLTYVNAFQTT